MFSLQGHRGARAPFPENTLGGFQATIAMGIRTIELDVGVTRDGAVVVHHDPALNPDIARDRSGAWLQKPGPLLRELTLAQLAAYDVGRIRPGSSDARRFPKQAGQDGVCIPTLDMVLALDDTTAWNIELKSLPVRPDATVSPEEMAERVLHVAGAAGALDRITIQSFDWRAPRHVRRIRPSVARGWLTTADTVANASLWLGRHVAGMDDVPDAIAAEEGGTWTPQHAGLTQDLLHRAHGVNLLVIPWTVNDPGDMRRLIGWGVDGLITDWPDRGLRALANRPAEAKRS
jgi:glycerophosphoryl diester phosphodiesterase